MVFVCGDYFFCLLLMVLWVFDNLKVFVEYNIEIKEVLGDIYLMVMILVNN